MNSLNFHKQDMASVNWLSTHFFAKSNERFKQISQLPIYKGDRVLDLCCGPGLYLKYFTDLVGPDGHVTGVDHDPLSLDFAHKYLASFPFKNWDLVHCGLENFIEQVNSYDVVVIFNAIGYFSNPSQVAIDIASKMKKGSRLIIKDFDLESTFIVPTNNFHFANLIHHAKKQDKE